MRSATVEITHTTVASNTAYVGGGVANAYLVPVPGYYPAAVAYRNSLIAGNVALAGAVYGPGCINTPGAGGANAATLTSRGYNLEDRNTCQLAATGDLTNTNPLIEPLANNGGPAAGSEQPAWTHALQPGSPAINAIPIAACAASTDERGVKRPQGPGCDIGAFEWNKRYYFPIIMRGS